MPSTDYLTYAYAALVASGGVLGYVKKGSIPSLAAGLAFGAVIGLGAFHTSQNPNRYYVALGASAALTVFMGKRFLSGGKFMPAGLVACVSLLMLARFSARALGLVQVKNE